MDFTNYKCTRCGTERKYGLRPSTSDYEPLINCETCGKPTRHAAIRKASNG